VKWSVHFVPRCPVPTSGGSSATISSTCSRRRPRARRCDSIRRSGHWACCRGGVATAPPGRGIATKAFLRRVICRRWPALRIECGRSSARRNTSAPSLDWGASESCLRVRLALFCRAGPAMSPDHNTVAFAQQTWQTYAQRAALTRRGRTRNSFNENSLRPTPIVAARGTYDALGVSSSRPSTTRP